MAHKHSSATLPTVLLCLLMVAAFCFQVRAANLTVTVQAGSYQITEVSEGWHAIDMDGFGYFLTPGKPMLPARTFLIALPPGAEVSAVTTQAVGTQALAGEYDIEATPPFFVPSADAAGRQKSVEDWQANFDQSYGTDDAYPAQAGEYLGMGGLRQYAFARVRFCPFVYHAQTRRLEFVPALQVSIDYEPTDASSGGLVTNDLADDQYASKVLYNFDQAQAWYGANKDTNSPTDLFDLVIITTDDLVASLDAFVTWKEQIGFSVNAVTTSWIYGNYTGVDQAEQIRNFLIDKYLDWGIEYVMIVGNVDLVPMRMTYPDSANHGYDPDFCVPTDIYYSDLSGNWDSDGDGYFGEWLQDDVDFVPEIHVGRIPWNGADQVDSLLQKLVDCEGDTGVWKNRALLMAAFAWFENQGHNPIYPRTDFADLEEIIRNNILTGWTTTTMYEKTGLDTSYYPCDFPLTSTNVINDWSEGQYGVVSWGGHGSYGACWRTIWGWDDGDGVPEYEPPEIYSEYFISTTEVPYLDNAYPAVVWSTACNNGVPEYVGIGRALMLNGAAAVMASSRVAYAIGGWAHQDDGLVATMNYYFLHYMLTEGQKLGQAVGSMRELYFNNFMGDHVAHFHDLFCYNLYGDPSMTYEGLSYVCVDSDGDGFGDAGHPENMCDEDNCPDDYNLDQADTDGDGIGDACCCAQRGDFDHANKGSIDISDLVYVVDYMFDGGPGPGCPEEGDIDGDESENTDIADLVYLVDYMFNDGPAPPPCP